MQNKSTEKLLLVMAATAIGGCTVVVPFEGKAGLPITGTPPAVIHKVAIQPAGRVKVTDKAIEINEKIQFEVNKATILPASFGLLDEIAGVMKGHPDIKRVEIQGHASSEGDHATNLTLSDQRAKSVMTYLTTKGGVEAGRFTAMGYGDKVPIGDNNTEAGREQNRRVEFHILERK